MAKTVEKLKKKHTEAVWIDHDGDVWFFHGDTNEWVVLIPTGYGGFEPTTMFHRGRKQHGPFTKLADSTFMP